MSFSGNTAEIAAASGHPALAAAAPLYPDFDPVMHNAMPGGILNVALVKAWSESNLAMDANQGRSLFFAGTASVDGDRGGRLLKAAIAGHRTIDTYAAVQGLTYADDLMAPAYPAWSLSPWSHRAGIEASAVPLYVRVGWMDASTVNGALEHFLTYSNPQTLVIGPWSHGGFHFYDPFLDLPASRRELEAGQARDIADFLQPRLEGRGAGHGVAQPLKMIRYYTFGEGAWKTAATWPAPGFETRRLWFAQGGRLSAARPAMREGADYYAVDYSATTGSSNRWHTNLGGGAVLYPDRRAQDASLLCYTSEALATDLEVTGLPVLTLNLSANTPDAAIFVYLEDVAPDGRVGYITEGELRALHRRISTGTPPHAILGPYHSMERKDGSPLEPGRNTELQIALQSTSVLLRKGHRIRIAIAGQDAASFARIPGIGDTAITVERNGLLSSWLDLPARARE